MHRRINTYYTNTWWYASFILGGKFLKKFISIRDGHVKSTETRQCCKLVKGLPYYGTMAEKKTRGLMSGRSSFVLVWPTITISKLVLRLAYPDCPICDLSLSSLYTVPGIVVYSVHFMHNVPVKMLQIQQM